MGNQFHKKAICLITAGLLLFTCLGCCQRAFPGYPAILFCFYYQSLRKNHSRNPHYKYFCRAGHLETFKMRMIFTLVPAAILHRNLQSMIFLPEAICLASRSSVLIPNRQKIPTEIPFFPPILTDKLIHRYWREVRPVFSIRPASFNR